MADQVQPLIRTFGGRLFSAPKGMEDETEDCDEDTGVRHVEGRPGMREGNMKIEKREIDDVPV